MAGQWGPLVSGERMESRQGTGSLGPRSTLALATAHAPTTGRLFAGGDLTHSVSRAAAHLAKSTS